MIWVILFLSWVEFVKFEIIKVVSISRDEVRLVSRIGIYRVYI